MQKNQPQDWHRADIVAALKKQGWSVRRLSIEWGLSPNTLRNALYQDYPKGERIIAAALKIKPETIWPQRYAKRTKPFVTQQMRQAVNGLHCM